MPRPLRPAPPPLDTATLEYALKLLAERLHAVAVYGAGGCPTCHEAEARAFLVRLREFADSLKLGERDE